jgi:hypothetical protein
MSHISLDNQIDLLEERINLLAATVVDGSPDVLQSVSGNLQLLTVELKQMLEVGGLEQLGVSGRISRVRSLAAGLATVREGLLRQSAYVDRALELIVPAMHQKSTYPGSKAYGAPVRQSGAFSVLAA